MCPSRVVGVDVSKIFLFGKVLVRSVARRIGSASLPDAAGYLSISSRRRYLTGRDASELGLFDPARTRYIPSNCSSSTDEARSSKSFAVFGESLIAGISLFFDTDAARASVGYTSIAGAGSCDITYRMMFCSASVPPTCVGLTKITFSVRQSLSSSMIPARYCVVALRHGPGLADDLLSRILYFSAHSLTVSFSGGRRYFTSASL